MTTIWDGKFYNSILISLSVTYEMRSYFIIFKSIFKIIMVYRILIDLIVLLGELCQITVIMCFTHCKITRCGAKECNKLISN